MQREGIHQWMVPDCGSYALYTQGLHARIDTMSQTLGTTCLDRHEVLQGARGNKQEFLRPAEARG